MKCHLMFLYGLAFFKSQILLLPVLLRFYLDNGLRIGDYFLFQGIMTFLTIFLEIPVGYFSDQTSPKIILRFSMIFLSLRSFLWIFESGYTAILLGEFFYALSKVCFDSIASSYIFGLLKKKKQQNDINKIYGHFNFVMYFSTALSSLLGVYFYQDFGISCIILLDFLFGISALLLTTFLPETFLEKTQTNWRIHFDLRKSLDHFRIALQNLKNRSGLIPMILYSGSLVAFSNFIFWSFQPLLKANNVPLTLIGVVIFFNNIIRCCMSFCAQKIQNVFHLNTIAHLVFWGELSALPIVFWLSKNENPTSALCIAGFFCICIGFQLVFTINHISLLHTRLLSKIRSTISALNMMIARFLTASLLLSAKFLIDIVPIETIIILYLCLFLLPIGLILLPKIDKKKSMRLSSFRQ